MFDFFTATLELFEPYLGQDFILQLENETLVLKLAEAKLLPKRNRPDSPRLAPRDSFSLIWIGPRSHFLPQGLYTLSHPNPEIGRIEGLMMTPVGEQDVEYRYQSIFN